MVSLKKLMVSRKIKILLKLMIGKKINIYLVIKNIAYIKKIHNKSISSRWHFYLSLQVYKITSTRKLYLYPRFLLINLSIIFISS